MALAETLEKKLREGLESIEISLDDSALDKAMSYLDLLLTRTKKVNLTAIRDPEEAVEKHLIDSLCLVPLIDRLPATIDTTTNGRGHANNSKGALMDIGSGGGLPGIPLKCARPEIRMSLVEAKAKKVRFLKDAIQKLGLKGVRAYHHFLDPECPVDFLGRYDWIVSRASLSILEFVRSAILYKKENGSLLLMKGPNVDDELEAAAGQIQRLGLNIDQRINFKLPFSKAGRTMIILR
jgi:16S rRNA (guanine527-N7)-methyltransferase